MNNVWDYVVDNYSKEKEKHQEVQSFKIYTAFIYENIGFSLL